MPVTVEELRAVLRMEMKPFQRDLQSIAGINAKTVRQIENTWRQANRSLDGIGKSMLRSIATPLTGIATVLGARELIQITDTYTDLNGRIVNVVGSAGEAKSVWEELGTIARRTYSDLANTTENFLNNSTAISGLGHGVKGTLEWTEALNNALVISGAKGDRAKSVMNALSKAMLDGTLRGENLNTVIQTGGRVATALADGLGVTIEELKSLGSAGSLSSQKVFKALTSQMGVLRDEADRMQATISDAFVLLQNSFLEYVGGMDEAAGASNRIAQAIILLSDNLDGVANAALIAATAIGGALAGRAMLQAGAQVISLTGALGNFVDVARKAQGIGGLGAAFGTLGAAAAPIAMLIGGAAALALGHFANRAMEAQERSAFVNNELERMGLAGKKAAEGLDDATAAQERLATAKSIAQITRSQEAMNSELEIAIKMFDDFTRVNEDFSASSINAFGAATSGVAMHHQEIARLTRGYKEGTVSLEEMTAALDAVARSEPDLSGWIAEAIELGDNWFRIAAGIRAVNAEAATVGIQVFDPLRNAEDRDLTNDPISKGNAVIKEHERRLALTKEQRDIEDEINRIRAGLSDDVYVSDRGIAKMAADGIAAKSADSKAGRRSKGEGSNKKSNEFIDAQKSIKERIELLQSETELQSKLNPLASDYNREVAAMHVRHELLNAAKKAGLTLSPQELVAVDALAQEYANATIEAERLAEAQASAQEQMQEWMGLAKSATRGFIDDLIEGKSAAEALGNALQQLGMHLINLGMNSLFGTGSGSNPFGLLGNLIGFSDGGYTGNGNKYQAAGIVHKGEFVFSKQATQKAGAGNLEALHRNLKGFADGGLVGSGTPNNISLPRLPTLKMEGRGAEAVINFAPVIDARGADSASVDRIERALVRMKSELVPIIQKTVSARKKNLW